MWSIFIYWHETFLQFNIQSGTIKYTLIDKLPLLKTLAMRKILQQMTCHTICELFWCSHHITPCTCNYTCARHVVYSHSLLKPSFPKQISFFFGGGMFFVLVSSHVYLPIAIEIIQRHTFSHKTRMGPSSFNIIIPLERHNLAC